MNIGELLAGAGVARTAMDDARMRASEREYRSAAIRRGINDIEDYEAARPERNEIAQLKREIEKGEIEFKRLTQPMKQSIETADLQHKVAMQPGKHALERDEQVGKTVEMRQKALAQIVSLHRAGDKQGAIEAFNKSSRVAPGRTISDIVDVKGADGLDAEGTVFIASDGQQHFAVPKQQLDGLLRKFNSKYINAGGGNVVEVGPDGAKLAFSGGQQAHDLKLKQLDREYELKRQLEADKRKNGGGSGTALQKNIEYLISQGIASNATEAYQYLRTAMEKPESDAIASIATNLMRGPGFAGPNGADKAIAQAKKMLAQIRGGTESSPTGPSGGSPYKSDADVRAAYRAKKIDRATALRELQRFGYDAE